jgi:hypothetical protein
MEARLETTEESWIEVDLSLCCSVTLIKQSTPPLALESHGKLPNDTNRGKDNEDSEIVSFVWLTFLGSSIVADWARVSEMDIWKGRRWPAESSIDCWVDLERGSDLSINDSKSVVGRERVREEEELIEEEIEEAERKNEEERREGVAQETTSWPSNMSDLTNSLYTPNNDTNNEASWSLDSAANWEEETERPDTHKSTTFTTPDSDRSSIDRPTSQEIFKISTVNTAISLFDSTLKLR